MGKLRFFGFFYRFFLSVWFFLGYLGFRGGFVIVFVFRVFVLVEEIDFRFIVFMYCF